MLPLLISQALQGVKLPAFRRTAFILRKLSPRSFITAPIQIRSATGTDFKRAGIEKRISDMPDIAAENTPAKSAAQIAVIVRLVFLCGFWG